ncbi:MAG: type I restriction endonuclease subunit R [Verrucomicrobia bacterium]|nr:type I restriction endonuclease subunit R [Verrucomicrobiota bacterium]MCH8511545.1 HsdR family type I site-specific deoxyribonuclease [Kiritimatiellia bacterium]
MSTPSFQEDHISQIPAIQVLQRLGYTYLRPQEAFVERGGKYGNVLLEGVLAKQLAKMNRFEVKGREYTFGEDNIRAAVDALKSVPFDGLVRTNEKIYDLLVLGKSFDEEVQGIKKSPQLHYIDWINPKTNVYHVCDEVEVSRAESPDKTRRPDIVCYVNGIPFVVIECKRPDVKDAMKSAISQHIRNQRREEIPGLFVFSQVLMALSKNEAMYATTGTPAPFWASWRESEIPEEEMKRLVNLPISADRERAVFQDQYRYLLDVYAEQAAEPRLVTDQDRALISLCRPDRLLELTHRFVLFEKSEKKIARYQQYFAVKKTMARVLETDEEGRRRGGVVWHTQGSGKSLTMVMLARALALEPSIPDPRIVLVTDRVDLDDQIWKTFLRTGKTPERAKTGADLLRLLKSHKASIITTVINKFEASVKKKAEITGRDIFVLVDESHRTQYGKIHAQMQRVLPNACYIGFTGTPLMGVEKDTARKFGGMIDTYSIQDAVGDQSVVPLLYEGRIAYQQVNEAALDKAFGVVAEGLGEYQVRDLKRKFSSTNQLYKAKSRQWNIAHDISEHFSKNWQGTPFKGQLAADSKRSAIRYKKFLDELGKVSSEVLISAPDTREDNEDVYEASDDEVQRFWARVMEKYGDEKTYNEQLIHAFKYDTEPEIIIVVHKLLTGFDAPRNAVLYVDRSLKNHSLLQAIARVNRLYEGKDFGFIVDYYGIIQELGDAMDLYATLPDYEKEDLMGAVRDVREEIRELPQAHSELWDVFRGVKNKNDEEAFEVSLAPEDQRELFYEKLSAFNRRLATAFSTVRFYQDVPQERIDVYTEDLAFFLKLRASVKRRYAETVDFSVYEERVRKLVDSYVTSHEVEQITPPTNIFEKAEFRKELEKLHSDASKADTIAFRTKKTLTEKWDEDPFFYRKFSKILEKAIEDYRNQRISAAAYLSKAKDVMEAVLNHSDASVPPALRGKDAPRAFYGAVVDVFHVGEPETDEDKNRYVEMSFALDEIIRRHVKVQWAKDEDAQNRMRNDMDEFLVRFLEENEMELDLERMDRVVEDCISIAKKHHAR